jgi:tmRNA-binding protein
MIYALCGRPNRVPLLHKKEIAKINEMLGEKGLTLVPLSDVLQAGEGKKLNLGSVAG